MAELCRFGDNEAMRCILSATKIRGMNDLLISGETNTKNATLGTQEYVQRKSGKPLQVCFSVTLSAFTGCSTRSELASLITAARDGKEEYLYVGGQKLVPCKLMLIKAEASDFVLTPKGEIAHCVVALTFSQCSGNDGASVKNSKVYRTYRVRVPGMPEIKVTATSPAGAINKAAPSWKGTIYVDDVAYDGQTQKKIAAASNTSKTGKTASGMNTALKAAAKGATTAGKKSSASVKKKATAGARSRIKTVVDALKDRERGV